LRLFNASLILAPALAAATIVLMARKIFPDKAYVNPMT